MLIVDDQHGVCVSLAYLFEAAGYRVLMAESGRAALAVFESEEVAGAIIDVHMPIMNGFSVCEALLARAAALRRSVHVWFMTGAYTEALQRRCVEVGGIRVFRKPFDFPGIWAALDSDFAGPASVPCPVSVVPAESASANGGAT
jgi:CheY-like chemotaxis protein